MLRASKTLLAGLSAFSLLGILAPSASADFTVTGKFQYTDREFVFGQGFTGVEPKLPIRQAEVQVINNSTGAILATGDTDENGDISIFVAGSGTKNIVVRCFSRSEVFGSKNLRVTNSSSVVYSLASSVFSNWSQSSNLNIGTVTSGKLTIGWLQGNPFNMLDMMVSGIQYIKASGGTNPAQSMRMSWPGGSGSYASGTTAFMATDDGYDDIVQLHELGHVVHNVYSDSDSPGGGHSFSQSDQDPRLSLGEGWASFYAGAVRQHRGEFNPGFYMDCDGNGSTGSGTIQLRMRFEDGFPYGGSTGGEGDEGAVFCTLWDTVDTIATNDGNTTDDDPMDGSVTYAGKTGDAAMWSGFVGPVKSAANLTIRNIWDGWFLPTNHGALADITQVFTGWKMRFFPDSLEPNNTQAAAAPISPSSSYKGIYTLYSPQNPSGAPGDGDSDYYSFPLSNSAVFEVETRYPNSAGDAQTYVDPFIQIYRPNGTLFSQDDDSGTGRNGKLVNQVADVSGVWKVRVFTNHSYRKTGSYELRVEQVSGPPPSGGAPVITSVSQSSMDAVVIDGPGVVTVTGQNFSGTTSVKVDGIQLTSFPPQFSIPNDSTLIFIMPLVSHLGAIAVDITNATGTTGTTVDVVANSSPTVEMKSSDPGFLIQGLGLQLIVGSQVGDILVVEGSPELLSSSLPGIADFAIGNNFSSLFLLGAPAIPSTGYQELVIPMSGLPIGMKIHVQAAGLLLSDSYAFPTTMSNVQTGTVLF